MEEIKTYMAKNSYLELEDDEQDFLSYSTRDNGHVYDEKPGIVDIHHARKIAPELRRKFPVECNIEYVDEWVTLYINKK